MHRELKLVENGITIATYYSDHNDHDNTLNQDMEKFMSKIKVKQAGNFDWTFELKKAFKESFPEIITKPILGENELKEKSETQYMERTEESHSNRKMYTTSNRIWEE